MQCKKALFSTNYDQSYVEIVMKSNFQPSPDKEIQQSQKLFAHLYVYKSTDRLCFHSTVKNFCVMFK